ncbi:C40 family peptidase [Klebsiella variicola subsp. variicola]|nr:C40 family peptidase [Klebsiella variicola subsp. variicola]
MKPASRRKSAPASISADLLPGDLVFFKTGSGESGLHVGIYDTDNQFIHASTSQGVTRSSLDNVYWNKKVLAGAAYLTSFRSKREASASLFYADNPALRPC